jgi:hypothetical protein
MLYFFADGTRSSAQHTYFKLVFLTQIASAAVVEAAAKLSDFHQSPFDHAFTITPNKFLEKIHYLFCSQYLWSFIALLSFYFLVSIGQTGNLGCRSDSINRPNAPTPTFPPTNAPTTAMPTAKPDAIPTSFPTMAPVPNPSLIIPSMDAKNPSLPVVHSFGGSPPASRFPLGLCEGDCDDDGDCAGNMIWL